ncbi:MAG: ZIP family metal transporter [Microgenomates group bacterium]
MPILFQILLATAVISCISIIANIYILRKKISSEHLSTHFVSFAAGMMLTTAFLDLLPEAAEHIQQAPIFTWVLAGIVVFFFMERYVLWFHHHDEYHGSKPSSVLILIGDSFHNMFDGVAIAAAFMTNPTVGVVTTLAIAAHEIPQEIADFTVLIHGGLSKEKALYYNFLSALTAFAGAFAGYYFLNRVESLLPTLLAFSAGMFIYIACSDLIPDMHTEFKKQRRWKQSLPFIMGLLVGYFLITAFHH